MIDTHPDPVMAQGTSQGDTVHLWERQERKIYRYMSMADLGWDTVGMGGVQVARAIGPLCTLWCIPGFLGNAWTHAFKLLRRTGVDWRTA
jgi:hypothetical protein